MRIIVGDISVPLQRHNGVQLAYWATVNPT